MNDNEKPVCSSKHLLISCILDLFASNMFLYFQIPREIIRLILSHYHYVETHFNIGNIDRDMLFRQLWLYAKSQIHGYKLNCSYNICTKEALIALPGSDKKTYMKSYNGIPIELDIYSQSSIINISLYEVLYGEDKFKFVFDVTRNIIKIYPDNWKDIEFVNCYLQKKIYPEHLPKEGAKARILGCTGITGECILSYPVGGSESITDLNQVFNATITKSYSILYEPGMTYDIHIWDLAIYSTKDKTYKNYCYQHK